MKIPAGAPSRMGKTLAGRIDSKYNHLVASGISMDVETLSIHPATEPVRTRMPMSTAQPRPDSEHELVQRAAAGDVAAFEDIYRANSNRVYLLCLRMSANPALAEELAQEAFVRAWQKLGSFRGTSAFSTWLHRVTVNVVLGNRRSTARREARIESAGDRDLNQIEGRNGWPGDALDLERAVMALPDRARTVFVLHDIEGFRHREIADMTGVAVGTSKAQLHRARKILRKALKL